MSQVHASAADLKHGHPDHGPAQILLYYKVYAALMVLLAVTVLASFFHFGPFNLTIAMTIALVKAGMVVLYFMHLKDSPRLTWIAAVSASIWIVIMIAGIVTDYFSRKFPGEDLGVPLQAGQSIEADVSAPTYLSTDPRGDSGAPAGQVAH